MQCGLVGWSWGAVYVAQIRILELEDRTIIGSSSHCNLTGVLLQCYSTAYLSYTAMKVCRIIERESSHLFVLQNFQDESDKPKQNKDCLRIFWHRLGNGAKPELSQRACAYPNL